MTNKLCAFFYRKAKKFRDKCCTRFFLHNILPELPIRSVKHPCYLIGGDFVHVGKRFQSGPGLRIEALKKYGTQFFSPRIKIGNNVSFGYNCHLGAINNISICDNVMIGSQVLITDHQHGSLSSEELNVIAAQRPLTSKGPVCIKENVWIGDNVIIMPNITIGKNAVIGANAVVTKDIPENSVAGGIPAKVIKQL